MFTHVVDYNIAALSLQTATIKSMDLLEGLKEQWKKKNNNNESGKNTQHRTRTLMNEIIS